MAQAKTEGADLVGPNGLLSQLTANVRETALEVEIDEHTSVMRSTSSRGEIEGTPLGGRRAKTVLTEIGPVEIEVPRDTDATVAPTDTEGTTDDGDVIRVSDRGTARWPSHS